MLRMANELDGGLDAEDGISVKTALIAGRVISIPFRLVLILLPSPARKSMA